MGDDQKNNGGCPRSDALTEPLVEYLCAFNECSIKELHALLQSTPVREKLLANLQKHCNLRTNHLRPQERNMKLHAHGLSVLNADQTFAYGGYLDITVRQYYFIKRGMKLKYPYLPCMIEYGGGAHESYFPLEVIHVVLESQPSSLIVQQ